MTAPRPLPRMLVSLTGSGEDSSPDAAVSLDPQIVGGKGASLAKMGLIPSLASHVPKSHALTLEFFRPWIKVLLMEEKQPATAELDEAVCARLQAPCQTLTLNAEQQAALDQLVQSYSTRTESSAPTLLAIRSSAPEEDGTAASFAGAFETKLGVPVSNLEQAVRDCFASRFRARVFLYIHAAGGGSDDSNVSISFAVVVMEMVNAHIAGVAFSANPLNSDRDEMVVDSSYGLGESVVDGSVTADRYIYEKVSQKVVSTKIGKKTLEKKLVLSKGGVETATITDIARQEASSLTEAQLHELAELVCAVEKEYGMPMDVEWAYTHIGDSSTNLPPVLRLLQARPITTLFYIDDKMMTAPGEKRILYYDYNVVIDCTTTDPFTHMDMSFYTWASSAMMGFPDRDIFTADPNMPIFKASTRQYCNMSIFLKFMSTETCSKSAKLLDPYLSSLFASNDCDREKYAMKKLPQGVNLRNLCKLIWQLPIRKLYKIAKACKKDPEQASLQYQEIVRQDMVNFKALEERGPKPVTEGGGLQSFANELFQAMSPSFEQELGLLWFVILDVFKKLDKERREGKTEEIRSEYGALCGGYVGDGLMEMNIDIHRLANQLPEKIWQEYPHEDLHKLASRIQANLEGEAKPDLPMAFLKEWKTFMNRHGWDGQNQLFPSCPRYRDSPVLLLAKLRQNVGPGVTNPAEIQREQVENRRRVMALHDERAKEKKSWFWGSPVPQTQQRNAYLEHLMWIRNNPKLHWTQMCGILRGAVLKVEENFLQSGRLEHKGDIFHVNLNEVDQALREDSFDLIELVSPRRSTYERAVRAKECPMMVDSRCRIIRADPPQRGGEEEQDGVLIGAAVSPGIATGRVRIIHNPSERFERGEILAAVVTGPAWTPMFAGASAIILQVGGALQHGALCAREYGKPAVSNIDIHSLLKTGMIVTVDGGTGTIKILEVDEDCDDGMYDYNI